MHELSRHFFRRQVAICAFIETPDDGGVKRADALLLLITRPGRDFAGFIMHGTEGIKVAGIILAVNLFSRPARRRGFTHARGTVPNHKRAAVMHCQRAIRRTLHLFGFDYLFV